MVAAVRTPLHHGGSLALGNKRYRKQLLKAGPLHYQGGIVDISPDMISGIVEAFDAKAQTRVPFQLADASNAHTMDPLRRKGFVTALHQTEAGLDGIIELEDEAARLVDTDPEFGVSVLVSPITTGEGQSYDAVLQHVLGTYSPVITTLEPWSIAASQVPADGLIDFLALSTATADVSDAPEFSDAEIDAALAMLEDETPRRDVEVLTIENANGAVRLRPTPTITDSPSSDEGANPDPSEGTDMPSLADLLSNASEDELRDLRTKLDAISPAENAVTEDDEVTDAEIEEALALVDLEPDEDDDVATEDDTDDESESEEAEPEAIAASHDAADTQLALANAQMAEQINAQGLELAQMRARVNESDWADRKTFYAQASVPGYLVDKAKPFLHGNDTSLKLSQSDKAQAAKLVDTLLLEFGGTLQRLGLAQGVVGTTEDTSAEQAQGEQRRSGVTSHLAQSGMLPARRGTATS